MLASFRAARRIVPGFTIPAVLLTSIALQPPPAARAGTAAGSNRPPDCSAVVASSPILWPPNHRLRTIAVTGVTDPDGDPVTIRVVGITQDEPAGGLSADDVCPDASIGTDGVAQVRLERDAGGNGRVYRVQFVATDGRGGTCAGAVLVCVPRSGNRNAACSDDGQTVNSLIACSGDPGPSPVPIIDDCRCTSPDGTVRVVANPFVRFQAPRDTCPANSRIDIWWHAEPPTATGFAYRFDNHGLPDPLVEVGPGVTSVTFNSGIPPDTLPVPAGTKIFGLRALGHTPGTTEATRYFWVDFIPDTWIAGPDPGVSGAPWSTRPDGTKFALLVEGAPPPGGLPGTLLSPDSVNVLPADRPERRTFLEIYEDTVFIRHEFDTVHLGSWVVFHNGGSDTDSRYNVQVADDIESLMPSFPGGVVLTPAGPNGSPIGFHTFVATWQSPDGPLAYTAESRLYPRFDPNDVLHFPTIAAYHPILRSGRVYSLQRAEDGDGLRDNRIDNPRQIVEFPANPYEMSLRPKVLVFDANFPPQLQTSSAEFRPRVDAVDVFSSRTWDLRLPATDADPFTPGDSPGGPSANPTLRFRFKVTGTGHDGSPLVFRDPAPGESPQKYLNVRNLNLLVPEALAGGPATLTVELCDCACDTTIGQGRCVSREIPVLYDAAPPIGGSTPTAAAAEKATEGAAVTPTTLLAPVLDRARGEVTIRFSLAAEGNAVLDLYDVTGQRVRRLASERRPAGDHAWVWDGRNASGRLVGAGVYFARLRTDDMTLTRKFFVSR